jgi:chromosome segregation ATPase
MASKEYSTIDHDKESDELVELQNENSQLNLELCTLHTNYENLESENNTLKEEIASLKEKIKNLEEYIDKIEEDDIVEKTQLNNNDIDILSESMLQSETDVNVLKHKILELQKEIIRLSDNIKEDLINNKNMQNEYESQIEILKNDITALENENDELRQEINDVKEKGQLDIKNCLEEISEIKAEKEQSEQKYMNKLEELNLIIKKYQNKIIEQENAYKALCDTSENKIKETYDKFTEEIKNIKSSQNQLDNMDGYNISDMNLEIHNLKTENFELNKKLENYVLNLTQKQKEFEDINNKYIILYKLEKENKNKIKKLEEENGNLRADLLNNNSDSDKEDNKKIKMK